MLARASAAAAQEWSDYLFPMGEGNADLGEELDGLDAEEAL